LETVRARGAAFDWELHALSPGGIITLHVAASTADGGLLVLGAWSRSALAQLAARVVPHPLPTGPRDADAPLPHETTAGQSVDVYEELSRINNELLNAQRTLAKSAAEQRRLSEENRRLYDAERTARAAAEAAVALRDQLLASVSHDLRTPLTTIRGLAQMLRRQAGRRLSDADWVTNGLTNIEVGAAKMAGMIDELLDAAHLQTGEPLELRLAATDLAGLARKVAAAHQALTDRHRIDVVATVPELVGRWDSARLERVLDNLLSNAIKYSPDGGGVVVQVGQQTDTAGSWAVVAVQDQGVGIPAVDLPHIFERFRRGTNVAGRIAGTGIGLAGAKQIVEQHGGTLTAASSEGHGATLTVRLPLGHDRDRAAAS
jgi:signal transduction histidine kinase